MKLTKDQQTAIDIRDANVLVSAAAGSGKTSVLTTRIVSRITDDETPVDIDRMLIMTFTNAAAAEMQGRIRDEIEKKAIELRKDPKADTKKTANLEKQSILVHNAMITTIHGFCKSVITDHFEEISIDPGFRVADENECKLIMQDALEECIEAAYEKGEEDFLKAVECFSSSSSAAVDDFDIETLIIPIYRFITADPDPEGFIEKCRRSYEPDSFEEFKTSYAVSYLMSQIHEILKQAKDGIDAADEIIRENEAILPYKAAIEAYQTAFTALFETDMSYDTIREHLSSLDIPALGRILDKKLDPVELEAKREVKSFRDFAKKSVCGILEMMPCSLQTAYERTKAVSTELKSLCDLVLSFGRIYSEKKREKNVIDFSDMEHMAIRILQNPEIAALYRERFVEIYVDEYQDTNMAQETLVSLICRHDPGNVFLVGDVKQSIYSFRHARPDLFIEKYNSFKESGNNRRILLNDNFRSRHEVTDSVNEVFSRIMKATLGGIEYDDDAKLNPAATCYGKSDESRQGIYRTKIITGTPVDLSAEEFTANVVASEILTMLRSGFPVYDKKKDIMRPVSPGDFVILVRSIKKFEPVFREVFTAAGIGLAVSGREGYFGTLEVKTSLAFLQAVDNPLCDIPFTAVLRSPIGGFSDRDIATVTAHASAGISMYERVKKVAGSETGDKALCEKCQRILDMLHRYKAMSGYTPVDEILYDFIEKEYGDYVRCMSRGKQRMANLSMLLSKAEDFGKTSYKGLYQFVRYMDLIRKYAIDDGQAGFAGENEDAVQLMTMHSSKGLEFPVCFIAGLEKRRNRQDENGNVICNQSLGFGIYHKDIVRRTRSDTLPRMVVEVQNRLDSIAEEMRVLYVAMTRAREKLIMVGIDKEDGFDQSPTPLAHCNSYLDMLKFAYASGGFEHTDICRMTEEDLADVRVGEKVIKELRSDDLLKLFEQKQEEGHESEIPEILSRARFEYPYPVNPDLRAKLSVSELKKALEPSGLQLFEEKEPGKYIPKFMRAEGETETGGTFYGTAFHRIMELWDYPKEAGDDGVKPEEVTAFAEKMYELHRIDRQQLGAIRPGDVAHFLNSPLGKRMKNAKASGKLYREQPFVIGIPDSGETVLIQGIIDAYFTEDDGITVVDYKTDRVSDEETLVVRYRAQLEYYGRALFQITHVPVKALMIYSTCLGREITVESSPCGF